MGKLTLILGGARSGKSTLAERLAAESGKTVLYIATAQALDEEMTARIAAHRRKRPPEWQTLELPLGVGQHLLTQPPQTGLVLMDCLTLLVSNVVLQAAGMEEQPDEAAATERVQQEVKLLLDALEHSPADWVIVSNEVGLGLVPPYPLGRLYRDLLGWANQQLAQRAARTLFMIAGLPMQLAPLSPDFKL